MARYKTHGAENGQEMFLTVNLTQRFILSSQIPSVKWIPETGYHIWGSISLTSYTSMPSRNHTSHGRENQAIGTSSSDHSLLNGDDFRYPGP